MAVSCATTRSETSVSDPPMREARCLARFIDAGLLALADVTGVLHGAGNDAGKPDGEITSVIAWAIAHPSVTSRPENIAQ